MSARRQELTVLGAIWVSFRWLLVGTAAQAGVVGLLVLLTWVSELVRPKPHRPVEVTWIQKPPLRPTAQPLPAVPPPKPPEVKKVQPKVPPHPEVKPQPVVQAPPPKPQPPAKKKEEPIKPPQVKEPPKPALIPQPPKPEQKPPEQQQPKPPEQPKVALPKERHKAVEVDDDKNVVKEPPADADYLSDKNRSVAEQTRDTRTNLEKQENGKASASEKSDDSASKEIGGEDDEVRQLEKAEASSLDKKNVDPTSHSGDKDKAVGLLIGTKGREGSRGESGDGGEGGRPGTLSMRNIEGRGAPGMDHSLNVAPSGVNDDAPEVAMSKTPGTSAKQGDGGKAGAPGAPGKRGPKLALDFEQYERAVGSDKYRDEIEVAKRSKSHKKGRWEKKLDAIHSSLENFVPEVKPGNQNALGTRAAPFAVYIARIHRKIHELWGFGFLSDLDLKSPTDPMNNRDLKVMLEIVINPDGTVDKTTIVKGSGVLTFDVAAIDSVMSAGPFEKAPQEIVSGNGKVYLHWTFHRDERQCSPYFADPFILDNAGPENEKRGLPEPSEEIARRKGLEKISRDGSPTKSTVVVPHVTREQIGEGDAASAARANANLPAPDDPAAQDAALAWANAFEGGDVGAMVAASGVPFHVGGQKFQDQGDLGTVWRGVLAEVSSHDIKEWKVMSPAGYRAVFGRLPKGADDAKLYLAARVGKEWLTLELGSSDGKYKVVGLYR